MTARTLSVDEKSSFLRQPGYQARISDVFSQTGKHRHERTQASQIMNQFFPAGTFSTTVNGVLLGVAGLSASESGTLRMLRTVVRTKTRFSEDVLFFDAETCGAKEKLEVPGGASVGPGQREYRKTEAR